MLGKTGLGLVWTVLHWAGAEEYVTEDWSRPGVQRLCPCGNGRLFRSRIPTIGQGKNHASERGPGDSSPSLTQFQSTLDTGNKQDFSNETP